MMLIVRMLGIGTNDDYTGITGMRFLIDGLWRLIGCQVSRNELIVRFCFVVIFVNRIEWMQWWFSCCGDVRR